MDKLFIDTTKAMPAKGITWKRLCTLVNVANFVEKFSVFCEELI